MARWSLYDPYLADTLVFEVNPREGGEPQVKKNVSTTRTCAPDGRRLVHEGSRSPQEVGCRGVVRSTAARDLLLAWMDKNYQVFLTNDLGEEHWVRFFSFTPTRKRVASRPYKAEYDLRAFVLDIP